MAVAYSYKERNEHKSILLVVLFALSFLMFVYLTTWGFFILSGLLAYFRPTGYLTWNSTMLHAFLQTVDTCEWLLPLSLAVSLFWARVALNEGEDFILGRLHGVRFLPKWDDYGVNTTLTNLCIRTGDIEPKAYVLKDKSLNAFSVGARPDRSAVVLTSGLLNQLTHDQLEAVLAHELAHIRNNDTRLMMVFVMCLAFFTFMGEYLFYGREKDDIYEENGIRLNRIRCPLGLWSYVGFMLLVYGYVIAPILRLGLSRTRERLADAEAALITRHPRALAKALWRISLDSRLEAFDSSVLLGALCITSPSGEPTFFERISGLYRSHPPVEERIYALNDMDGMFLSLPARK